MSADLTDVTESSGQFLARIGTDPEKWANEFLGRFAGQYNIRESAPGTGFGFLADSSPGSDMHHTVQGWFANAIGAGKADGYSANRPGPDRPEIVVLCGSTRFYDAFRRDGRQRPEQQGGAGMTVPAPHIPENPWASAPAETIVGELERLAASTPCITNRDACVLFEAADRLRAPATPPTFEPVDPGNTLFDVPRLRPPGSFYAIRRTDGGDIGEEQYAWITVDNADHWSPVEREAEWLDGPTEFEMVLMVPKRISVRTIGPKAGECTPRCGTEVGA